MTDRILKPRNVEIYPVDSGFCIETSDHCYDRVKSILNALMEVYGVDVHPVSEREGSMYAAIYYKMTGNNPANHPKLKAAEDGSLRMDNIFFIDPSSVGVKTPEGTLGLCREIMEHLDFFEIEGVLLRE